ncbi:hypothetical protein BRC86_04750 [Halobacteriales archaeon QS_3_64_16]|nr:MAG: hypothetical protein BRC86_04750 [Halobacteriales archaeon QS_3_64_16]
MRSIVAVYALVVLVPGFLWALSDPLLATGGVMIVGGTYVGGRVGVRVLRRLRTQRAVCIPRTDLCIRVVSR